MIIAEYRGISDKPLEHGRAYKITTRCAGGKLAVSVRDTKRFYSSLEQFLKEWKVRAVYHGN